ncbi:hypothetical protein BDW42DRAFT_180337 [Aspergillus taichungensis]|uniref:Uncharacterized protein n=1 Tax=Aspergillus taichungensis TaxID=482145 RepID=A0A2J5HFF3_9EURO|nr:hypothetical protein BDW42DRAFT_180337 [Aspergillus taichungensis]
MGLILKLMWFGEGGFLSLFLAELLLCACFFRFGMLRMRFRCMGGLVVEDCCCCSCVEVLVRVWWLGNWMDGWGRCSYVRIDLSVGYRPYYSVESKASCSPSKVDRSSKAVV